MGATLAHGCGPFAGHPAGHGGSVCVLVGRPGDRWREGWLQLRWKVVGTLLQVRGYGLMSPWMPDTPVLFSGALGAAGPTLLPAAVAALSCDGSC